MNFKFKKITNKNKDFIVNFFTDPSLGKYNDLQLAFYNTKIK